jgi:ankyrin repeat protein
VQQLLEASANVRARNKDGRTALSYAAGVGARGRCAAAAQEWSFAASIGL